METPDASTSVAVYEDGKISDISTADLGRRVIELNTEFHRFYQIADSAQQGTIVAAVAMGQIFDEASKRFDGEFFEWVTATTGGKISRTTAYNYRILWRQRARIFPPDGSAPTCRTLTDALIKVGLITDREETDPKPKGSALPWKLTFVHTSSIPPEKWHEADRLAFLTATQPVADLRAKIEALKAA